MSNHCVFYIYNSPSPMLRMISNQTQELAPKNSHGPVSTLQQSRSRYATKQTNKIQNICIGVGMHAHNEQRGIVWIGRETYQALIFVGVIDTSEKHNQWIEVLKAKISRWIQQNNNHPACKELPMDIRVAGIVFWRKEQDKHFTWHVALS